jgi:hypothetical protein
MPRRPEKHAVTERSASRGDPMGRGRARDGTRRRPSSVAVETRSLCDPHLLPQRSRPEASGVTTTDCPDLDLACCDRDPETISSRRLRLAYPTLGVRDAEVERSELRAQGYAVTGAAVSVDIRDGVVRDRMPLLP